MKIQRILIFLIILAIALSCPLQVLGQGGVEVNPAYIKGKIILDNYKYSDLVSSAYVYANADGNFNSNVNVNSDGTYTLTVNAPSDGTKRTYNIYARVYLNSGVQFDAGSHVSIDTVKGVTYTQDFSQGIATLSLDGSFTNDDWTYISAYFYSDTQQYLYCYNSVSKSGSHSFLIPAGIAFKWSSGYASPKNTDKYTSLSLDKKEFTAKSGETVSLAWSGTFPDKPVIPVGTVRGSISYSPLPEGSLAYHYLYGSNGGSANLKNDGSFKFDNYPAGKNNYIYAYSYFNNGYQYFRWPYHYFDLAENGEAVIDISAKPAMVKGKLNITGVKSIKDVSGGTIYAYGNTGDAYGGYSYDSGINKNTGEYRLYLTPGNWNAAWYCNLSFYNGSSKPDEYFSSSLTYYDYTKTSNFGNGLTVSALQVVEGYDMEVPTGAVTIKYISTDGSTIKSPSISGTMSEVVNGKQTRYANVSGSGSSQEVKEAQATIVAPPGTYTLNTSAVVNGSNVTFSPRSVVVIEGVHTIIEVNGPTLSVSSPTAELYTTESQITVKGTATDDVSVASVSVNGTDVAIKSTGNAKDPNEVGFDTVIPLSDGPNKLEVTAKDTAGKAAVDTRYVYKDAAKPTLNVSPADGTVTSASSITLSGTATDDNKVTSVTVNGLSVPFTSTNNPNDPNEVSFSKAFDIVKGSNNFTISATDNSKRTTTATRLIINADPDLTPPVFGEINDISLELSSSSGTAYTLPTPKVTDNLDPRPKVTNDAPAVFPLGKTTVTWTATDSSGNASTKIQNVTVADTVKPVLSVPKDISVNASGNKTFVDIGKATATDFSPVTVTNDAPSDGKFDTGTTDVTWTATDSSGNVTKAVQKITVVYTKPILKAPGDITVEASDVNTPVDIGTATASGISDIVIANDAPKDGKFPVGTTTVTWTATDPLGNSDTAVQKITVKDTVKPVITAPSDITIEASAVNTPVQKGTATATDIFDVTITNDAPKDDCFPLGTTTITWTATDANGNSSTTQQKITVTDTTKPVLTVPEDVTLDATALYTPVTIGQASATDIFDVTITNDAPKDGKFPVGTTNVTWTATDKSGNLSSQTQKVNVIYTKPKLTIPEDITLEATDIKTPVSLGEAKVVEVYPVTITNDAPDGSKFPVGTTTVTWTATDSEGNISTGTQKITVKDTVKPVITVPSDITLEASAVNTFVQKGTATATDIFDVTITNDAPKDDKFPLGTTTINWTATDANGNFGAAQQKITIVDTTKPVITVPNDITIEATAINTPVSLGQATASDIFAVSITNDAPNGGRFPLGTTTVTWKATDASGNYSTGTQKVTVKDTTKPVLNVPGNMVVQATGVTTQVYIGQAIASDIFPVTIENDAPSGGLFNPGETTVKWKATDSNGNVSYGTQKIIVTSQVLFGQVTHYGNIEANNIFSNGPVRINGSFTGNILSTSESTVTITGVGKIGTLLKNQPKQVVPAPSWQKLSANTTLKSETLPSYSEFTNFRYEKSVSTRGKVTINGLLVVKGDLNFNGDVNLNNAAIFCTGKVTFNGKVTGQGLIYSSTGITNYGDINFGGQLITNGTWEVSGTSKITSWVNQGYLDYFAN